MLPVHVQVHVLKKAAFRDNNPGPHLDFGISLHEPRREDCRRKSPRILRIDRPRCLEDAALVLSHRWHVVRVRDSDLCYAQTWVTVDRKLRRIKMHRMVLGLTRGSGVVDHINHNGLDNRRSNLRLCYQPENQRNRRPQRNSCTGLKGVYPRSSRILHEQHWGSRITAEGKRVFLGYFQTPEEAAQAYDLAALRLHGEFACTNFTP